MGKIKTALCIFAACACAFAADSDIAKIKEKADARDAQSQLAIGVLYSSGKGGVQKNPALALEYIKAAAEKNFAPAQKFDYGTSASPQPVNKDFFVFIIHKPPLTIR